MIDTLGRGGMGVVHRCRDAMGREVALKTITTAALGRLDDRLRREAQAIARLRHQNIVGLIAVGEDEGRPYVVMDLVRGEALDRALKRNGPLPPARAASIVRDVALALHHAHDHGVIHRDVKPANILIDEHGEPRLTDFGLAADTSATTQLTATGQILGTLQYMAPEQADGDRSEHGPFTDVWSAGAVLYACLTGRPPFDGGAVIAVVKKVLLDDPVPPSELRRGIPLPLERVTLRCLEKDPAKRWPSAKALADALAPFAEGKLDLEEPIRVERRPFAIIATSVGIAAAVLLLAYAWRATRPDATGDPVTSPDRSAEADRPDRGAATRSTSGTPDVADPAADDGPSLDELLEGAEDAFDGMDFAETLRLADAALARDRSSADGWRLRALGLQDPRGTSRAFERAAELYQSKVDRGDASTLDRVHLAQAWLILERSSEALSLLSRTLQGDAPASLGPRKRALASFLQASAFHLEGLDDPAIATLRAAGPVIEGHPAERLLAQLLNEQQRYDEAAVVASRYLVRRSTDDGGWKVLIDCLVNRPRRLDLATFWSPIDALLTLDPNAALKTCEGLTGLLEDVGRAVPPRLVRLRALALDDLDRTPEAIAALRALLTGAPLSPDEDAAVRGELAHFERRDDSPVARARTGLAAHRAGRPGRALELLEPALAEADPAVLGEERWAMHLALIDAILKVPGPEEERDRLTRALASTPPSGELPAGHALRYRRATLEYDLGDLAAALQTIVHYLDATPEDPQGWLLASLCAANQGHDAALLDIAERAFALGHDDPLLRTHTARAHSIAGRYGLARNELDRALEIATDPTDRQDTRFHLARSDFDLGDWAGGLDRLDRVDPSHRAGEVAQLRGWLLALERGDPEQLGELLARGKRALRAFDSAAAKTIASAAAKLAPRDPEPAWLRYRALADLEEDAVDAAVEALARYRDRDGESPLELARRAEVTYLVAKTRGPAELYREANELHLRALASPDALSPEDRWDAYRSHAFEVWEPLRSEGTPADAGAKACEILEGARGSMPPDHAVRVFYAIWLADAGRDVEALEILRAYVALQPRNPMARRMLATLERAAPGGR